MSILVVEDNPINAKLLLHNLTNGGYDTLWAANGKEALSFLRENQDIQLVLSDIMMPEMDGLELLCRLREQPEWQDLPVIMCTSRSDLETVKKAAQEGCRSYLVKPIQTQQLMRKVREVLGRAKAVLEDRSDVMAELGLSAKDYDGILAAFAELVDKTISVLERQSRNGAFTDHGIDLQNLSERAALLGAEKVGAVLDRLADTADTGVTPKENAAYPQLLIELKRLKNSLRCG